MVHLFGSFGTVDILAMVSLMPKILDLIAQMTNTHALGLLIQIKDIPI